MSLEVKTQIEERLTQSAFGAEKQCNQQTAKPTIAIEKRMDRFELHVNESGLDENGQLVFFIVKKMLKALQTLQQPKKEEEQRRQLSGRLPPIQFCERRNSPGVLFAPRPPRSRTP